MDFPDLSILPDHEVPPPEELLSSNYVSLKDMSYELAIKVPGAIYSPDDRAVILPEPTPRAAAVALALQPSIAIDHPELVELRDTAIKDVKPVDYATPLQVRIEAPTVERLLHEQGFDWLEFDKEVNPPSAVSGHACVQEQRRRGCTDSALPCAGPSRYCDRWPNQSTDLGYAAAMLRKIHGFILGWSRGYGKTIGTAAIIEANHYNSVVVAVPNSAKVDTWVRELEHYLPSHQLVVMGNAGPEKRADVLHTCQQLYHNHVPFVLITHHESVALIAGKKKRPSGRGMTVLDGWKKLKIQWDLKVVDESHRLKTAGARDGSQFHRAACKIPADNALALTGSMYENSWEELYGQLHFILPSKYRSKWEDWNNRHLDYVDGYGKICVGILEGHEELMRNELGVFSLVREKLDRTEHHDLVVELSTTQRQAYDELTDMLLTQLEDGTLVSSRIGVVQLTRLRQVAAGLDLLSDEIHDSTKIDRTIERIGEFPDDDFFVAVWHKAAAYSLAARLEALGYPIFVVTGDVSTKERERRIAASRQAAAQRANATDRLQLGHPSVVVIGTIATLGESVNLQHLNHVIRVELSFNPALNRQVVDRVDRTGQLRRIICDDIIANGTVDQVVVLPNLANKNAMRAMLLGRGA